jgi:hypothetical protein
MTEWLVFILKMYVRCNVTEQTYEIILVLRHIPSLSNNIPAAIPAKATIKVIGWTIPLRGGGDSEMNSHLFVLFSQYFVTGKAKSTIINATRMVTPISEEIAPLLIKTSSNRSNLLLTHYSK